MHNTAINMENMGKRRFTPPQTAEGGFYALFHSTAIVTPCL